VGGGSSHDLGTVPWAMHLTLSVSLLLGVQLGTSKITAGGNTTMDQHPIQGGIEMFLVPSCYRNQDTLQPEGPLGSYADLMITFALLWQ